MYGSEKKDAKERYLTYSITVRPADKEKGVEEEVVTKKMSKFIDGGPKDFLEWVYHFKQLGNTKPWNAEDKFLNTTLLLEGDLRDAFDDASITDDDVRMDDEFWKALYTASKVILPVDYSEKLQEELWEIKKTRGESLAEYSKRFRALARMENTLAGLSMNSPMCEDALCRLFKRGLPYDWQNKYDASGQVYTTVAALVPFFERIEQGEQRLHRAGESSGQERRNNSHHNSRGNGRRSNYNTRNNNRNNQNRQQNRGGNRGRGSNDSSSNNNTSNKYCSFHRTTTHNTQDCRALQQNNQHEEHQQVDHQHGNNAQRHGGRRQVVRRQVQTRVEQRTHRSDSSSDEEYMFLGLNAQRPAQEPPMRITIKLEHGKTRYHALLDTGCSRSIIRSDFMQTLQNQSGKLQDSRVSYQLAQGSTSSTG